MIQVRKLVRRQRTAICCECGSTIEVGEGYREIVAIREFEIFGTKFVRQQAHLRCSAGQTFIGRAVAAAEMGDDESRAYVRERYGLDARPGRRCRALGKEGVIERGLGGYVRVRLDGARHAMNYHPSDVDLLHV